ncbi:MAG: CRISPR-associated endonuclease Cas2 [Patescibacteria group bacterium]|nr:CRISPR-associated endonuclease Cas2 [Patescibacteria group bacterium]
MGNLEQQARKSRNKRDMQNAALVAVSTAGLIAVAALAPKLVNLLGSTGLDAKLRYQTKSVLGRLARKGCIEFVKENDSTFVRLTARGEQALEFERQKRSLANGKPRRWNKRYRLVIFDIPEKRRSLRTRLRAELASIGFLRIQDSTWLYPYDCEEFVAMLKAELRIGKDVLYAIVEQIENDGWIRKHFSLPSK